MLVLEGFKRIKQQDYCRFGNVLSAVGIQDISFVYEVDESDSVGGIRGCMVSIPIWGDLKFEHRVSSEEEFNVVQKLLRPHGLQIVRLDCDYTPPDKHKDGVMRCRCLLDDIK